MRPIGPEYMNPDHRLPTLLYTDERTGRTMNSNIPLYPQPSIFETTTAVRPSDGREVDHEEVTRVMARQPWDFEEANLRLHREALERRNQEFREQLARDEKARTARPAKKAATKKTTAKKAPAKKAAPKPPTRKGTS